MTVNLTSSNFQLDSFEQEDIVEQPTGFLAGDYVYIKPKAIDESIDHLLKFNLNEVMSVDENLNQNGALRAMKYKTVFDKNLSTYFGIIKTNFTDIHTAEDLESINEKE